MTSQLSLITITWSSCSHKIRLGPRRFSRLARREGMSSSPSSTSSLENILRVSSSSAGGGKVTDLLWPLVGVPSAFRIPRGTRLLFGVTGRDSVADLSNFLLGIVTWCNVCLVMM